MPYPNPVVLAPAKMGLRHIGPQSNYTDQQGNTILGVWPESPYTPRTVLHQTSMVAKPLPASALPDSPDWFQASWTARVGDAGEATVSFPNVEASDGAFWRNRFDPAGHLQWLETYNNEELESVVVFDQVGPITPQQVTVHGFDGMWLLKKAYERDLIITQAPRDVISRACSLWIPVVSDNFPGNDAYQTKFASGTFWTVSELSGTQPWGAGPPSQPYASVLGNNGLFLQMGANPSGGLNGILVDSPTESLAVPTSVWQAFVSVPWENLVGAKGSNGRVRLLITESSGDQYGVTAAYTTSGQLGIVGALPGQVNAAGDPTVAGAPNVKTIWNNAIPTSHSYALQIESDGMWVWAFVNGALCACIRRKHTTTSSLQVELALLNGTQSSGTAMNACQAVIGGVLVRAQQPWLQSQADPGDFVLPGDATTFPFGGLQGRYFNDSDLQSDPDVRYKMLNPSRTQAYGASSPAEYADRQEVSGIVGQANPQNGASANMWSAVWFGSIWLQMSQGDYQLQLAIPNANKLACRVWVGQTGPGQQLLDQGFEGSFVAGPHTYTFTVSQESLMGTLPYGQGSVARDGWYPIIIWYCVNGQNASGPTLLFSSVPQSSYPGASYTDPGGGTIYYGNTAMNVPYSSLSPLGCVDQRYQAIAHFDIIQQTLQAWGYQAAVEPKQLEAVDSLSNLSLFPGVLAPRIREGHDTNIVLTPDDMPRLDAEGILNPANTNDATEFAASIYGNGAGTQSNDSAVQGMAFDPATQMMSLFDAQMWQDFSDAAYGSLLQAFLNAQLSLVLTPWQMLSADPYGANRMAGPGPSLQTPNPTFDLPANIQAFRWRPGDGLQIRANVVDVWDSEPRQMLVVTRNFTPEGITGTQATFINRPRTAAHILRNEIFRARRWQRNYQRRHITLSSNIADYNDSGNVAAGSSGAPGLGPAVQIALLASDRVLGLILVVMDNTAPVPFGVYLNGFDYTAAAGHAAGLFGPWQPVPVTIDLKPILGDVINVPGFTHLRLHVANYSAQPTYGPSAASGFTYQMFAECVR